MKNWYVKIRGDIVFVGDKDEVISRARAFIAELAPELQEKGHPAVWLGWVNDNDDTDNLFCECGLVDWEFTWREAVKNERD